MPTDPNQPGSTDDYNSWLWEQGLRYILAIEQDANAVVPDRSKVANPEMRWLKWIKTETVTASSHPSLTPGANELVVWAPTGATVNTGHQGNQGTSGPGTTTYSTSDATYYVVHAELSFFVAQKDGKTPLQQWTDLHNVFSSADQIFQKIAADPNSTASDAFKPKSFGDVGLALEYVENWLQSSAWTLHQMTKSIDQDASGFSGSAADAFVTAVDNLHKRIGQLYVDMGGNLKSLDASTTDPLNAPATPPPAHGREKMWSDKVKSIALEQQKFATAMNQAYATYRDIAFVRDGHYNPGRLLDVLKSILATAPSNMKAAQVQIPADGDNYDVINGTYDLTLESEWLRIDTALKKIWTDQLNEFDKKMRLALKALKDAIDPITAVLDIFHNVSASRFHQGSANENGNGNGNGNVNLPKIDTSGLPNIGGGGGSGGIGDLPGGGGTGNLPGGGGLSGLPGGGGSGIDGIGGGGGLSDLPGGGADSKLGGGGLDGLGGDGSGLGGGSGLGTDIGGLTSGLGGGSGLSGLTDPGSGGLDGLTPGSALGGGGLVLPGSLTGLGGTSGGSKLGLGSGLGGSGLNSGGLGGSGLDLNSRPSKLGGGGGSAIGPLAAEALKGAGFDSSGLDTSGFGGGGGALGAGLDGSGSGLNGTGGPAGVGGTGTTAGGAGAGGMPFMPPMGGMGGMGSGEKKERERSIWLEEDEDVWGTDPDLVPAVLGRGDLPAPPLPTRPNEPAPTGKPGRDRPGSAATRMKPFEKVRRNDG